MATQYFFNDKLIVRTPSLPFKPDQLTEEHLKKVLNETWFQEAIYLASPNLYDMAISWLEGAEISPRKYNKFIISVAKYYSRMMTRCTPFGLFAACSLTKWSDKQEKLLIEELNKYNHTRFDMHFLSALAQKLSKLEIVKPFLRYIPNTSLYYLGNEIRYVEYKYINGVRMHQISSVVASEYLELILQKAKGGATYPTLVELLVGDEITTDEAHQFLDELIASQLLVNNLEPAITGKEFLEQIIETISDIYVNNQNTEIASLLHYLNTIKKDIEGINSQTQNNVANYRSIVSKISKFGIPFEENKLFQTDSFKKLNGCVSQSYKEQLLNALMFLNKLTPLKENPAITSFAKRFYNRYEDQEVAILELLDTETGIGYLENNSGDISPLIEGIVLPQETDGSYTINWNKKQSWLFEKLTTATLQKDYEVSLSLSDLEKFEDITLDDLPPSMSVMFKIVEDKNEKRLLLEGISGSSSINLLGRFAHGNDEIRKTCVEIADYEQSLNPDVVFAEIAHLPESRVGNILLHPVFRNYEIPYLSKSSVEADKQINLSDLYVSVKFGKVILKSRRLNKVVVPRLSTAHNFSYRALPVYQFLCDLQSQGLRYAFGFHWGDTSHLQTFLPRVVVGNVIVHLATWQFKKADLSRLIEDGSDEAIKEFIRKWKLPQFSVLADGDNELFIDWQNPLSINIFIDSIKSRERVILKEFMYERNATIFDKSNALYINQNIALLQRNNQLYAPIPTTTTTKTPETQRSFSIGSEWLYFKIYCGSKIADTVLTEYIKPITETLFENKLIDKWFFIRYSDPDLHLRVRFHLTDITHIGNVINCFYNFIKNAETAGYIWKIQTETYIRELERYDYGGIELAENLFYEDSISTLDMLHQTWGDDREKIRWLWGIRAINDLLDGFQFSLDNRLQLLKQMKDSFYTEFKVDVFFKQQIDKKYRKNREHINSILDESQDSSSEFYPLLCILKNKKERLSDLIENIVLKQKNNEIAESMPKLLSSYIHMLVNRLIPENQRLHELFIYDFMYRTYHSLVARAKKTKHNA